jgi:hypothetical protein
MRIALAFCVCVVAACGSVAKGPDAGDDAGDDAPSPDDGAVSGTRLKLKWIDYGGTRVGGAQARDTTANFDCAPVRWDDDRYYCTPATGSIVYTNNTCTSPIAYAYRNTTCPSDPPDYFVEYAIDPCIGYRTRRIYRRGALVAQTEYYQVASDGSCNGPYTDANLDYYAVGTQLGRGELVELTTATGDQGDRYAQQFFTSADGARMFDRIVDTQLATTCYFESSLDGATARCPPDESRYAGYFADSVCDTPAVAAEATCDAPDYLVQYRSSALCPEDNRPRYFTVGGTAPAVYSGGPTACAELAPDPNLAYYAGDTELAFPELPRTIGSEAGRQVQLVHFTDGALRLRGYGQVDVTYGVRCFAVVTAGGGYQCIPYEAGISAYFSEPTCTSPIEVVDIYRNDPSCDPPPVPPIATRFVGGCPATYQFYETGALYTGALYYAPGDGSCIEDTSTAYVRYALGAEIPQSAFAAGVDVVDP